MHFVTDSHYQPLKTKNTTKVYEGYMRAMTINFYLPHIKILTIFQLQNQMISSGAGDILI